MRRLMLVVCVMLIAIAVHAPAQSREKLASDTPKDRIVDMDSAKVDPSDLPLDRVGQLHPMGTPQEVSDLSAWRLSLEGKGLGNPLSLSYAELAALPQVKKRVLLICHGYPVRLVAEDLYGARWVKWLKEIHVE